MTAAWNENLAAPILPGATIGMVGGGQLGRMFVMAAARLGYEVSVFCGDAADPAAQLAHHVVTGPLDDSAAVDRFADRCAVITLEFENIPAATMDRCSQHAPTFPAATVLATAQDRWREKTTLRDAGLPVTPFASVRDAASLREAGNRLGWPMIVKTAISGYDGKGQYRVAAAEDADTVPWGSVERWVAESLIRFDREVSVIVARTPSGRTATYPVFENVHTDHILDTTIIPAGISAATEQRAREIAVRAAEKIDVVGLLCVEMFVIGEELRINEVAPRPHNSGHLTIEACHTSQFEQHVRAICDLPLGATDRISGSAAMANLLGDLWLNEGGLPDWAAALQVPGVELHLYGKRGAKRGRKMGHLTALADSTELALQRVRTARDRCSPRVPA